MKKLFSLLLILVLALGFVFANAQTEATASATTVVPPEPTWPINIKVCTAQSGDGLIVLQDAATAFNASQGKYVVELYRGGSYTDIATLVQTSTPTDIPDVFASSGNDTAVFINMPDRLYIPIQDFIDAEGYDASDIVPILKGNYARDDKWQCWPLGNTSVGQYFNVTAFKSVGVDVNTLKSYEEILVALDKLAAAGYKTFYSPYLAKHIDWLNYAFSAINVDWYDMGNGRDGVPTKSFYGEGEVKENLVAFFQFLRDVVDKGYNDSYDRSTSENRISFSEDKIAIYDGYSSGANAQVQAIRQNNFTDEWCFIPSPVIRAGQTNYGQSPGGGALFIANSGDYWRQQGAWEFMKYLQNEQVVTDYAMATGYVPTTKAAQQSAKYQEYIVNEFPSAATIIKAHEETLVGVAYAPVPWSTDANTLYKKVAKQIVDDPTYTAEQAATDFAEGMKEVIELYRLTNGLD